MSTAKLGIINLSRDFIRVTGSDALRFLNGMWTCDFKRAAVAATAKRIPTTGEGFLLNVKGKPISPAIFLCESETNFLLSVPAGYGQKVYDALDHYLVADDVELKLEANVRILTAPFGWNAAARNANELEVPVSVPGALDKVYSCLVESWGYRLPRGLLGIKHEELWLLKEVNFDFGAHLISPEEFLTLRIENGIPEWGTDYSEETLILEFPFARAISFHKGCYIGQEVVARATYRGKMNKGFARFKGEAALVNDFVYSEIEPDRAVGKLTSIQGQSGLGLIRFSAIEHDTDDPTSPPLGRLFQKQDPQHVLMNSVEVLL